SWHSQRLLRVAQHRARMAELAAQPARVRSAVVQGLKQNSRPTGGADNVMINSLAGTSVTQVNIDLAVTGGSGDGAADTVTVNGTESPDIINITASAGMVGIAGLAAQVQIAHPEVANDKLVVN